MKFLADHMLGKLAKELRTLGYDTLYYRGETGYPLIKLAREEGRVILTRNSKLLPRKPQDLIIRITEDKPRLQLRELIQKGYVSLKEEKLYSRCLLCNAPLAQISRKAAEGKVPDFIFYQNKEFSRCPQCLKIYWPGSHLEHMEEKIKKLFG
jgi:uncharacterized protein with PIN domain